MATRLCCFGDREDCILGVLCCAKVGRVVNRAKRAAAIRREGFVGDMGEFGLRYIILQN